MEKVQIKFKKLHPDAVAPFHAHEDDRGFDLTCVGYEEVKLGEILRYHSGLAFEFPDGIDAVVRARSSIYKTGLILSNGTGTIDHSYRGEVQAVFYRICLPLTNIYAPGERFCQMVIPGVDPRLIEFIEVDELSTTERGAGGYGSTGR